MDAVRWAQEEGCDLSIIGTVRQDKEFEDIDLLSEIGADVIALHATITDSYNWESISKYLKLIIEQDSIPGLVSHLPFQTTAKLLRSPILDLFDIYMIPVNKLGYLIDTDVFMDKERADLANLIEKINKKVIINKILAAGILTPEDAFNFLKTVNYADLITVGIASEVEAEETFNLLADK